MIDGVGVDVVETKRFQEAMNSWGNVLLEKIFTEKELLYSHSKKYQVRHLAARFAVKEAVAKAMATGWSGGFRWKDVEIENDSAGKPSVILHGKVNELLKNRKVMVSISHSENVVIAFAVIEK